MSDKVKTRSQTKAIKSSESAEVSVESRRASSQNSHQDELSSQSSRVSTSKSSSRRSQASNRSSSVRSAKEKKAVIEAKLKSQTELNKLELQQAEERADFERQQQKKRIEFERKLAALKREQEDLERNRRLQEEKLQREQEDFERNRRLQEEKLQREQEDLERNRRFQEEELKRKREEFERERQLQEAEFELERLDLQLSREQKERRYQHLLFESKLRADLEEANAEIAACDDVVDAMDNINKLTTASKTVSTFERNFNETLDCAKAPIFTVVDSIANSSKSAVSDFCVGLNDVTVQTSSVMTKTKPSVSQFKNLPHNSDKNQASLSTIRTAASNEGFHQLHHAETDSTKLSNHYTPGMPSSVYLKPGNRKGATDNTTADLKIVEQPQNAHETFFGNKTVPTQNSKNVQFFKFANGGPSTSQLTNGGGNNDHVNTFAPNHCMPQASHSALDDSNQFTSVHPNLRSVILTPPAASLEPEVFDGNPINYCSFIDAFEALIEYNVFEPKRRLYFLLQYTKGPAQALVKGCQYMPSDQAYIKARELLQQTFGQRFQIAKACIDRLSNGPTLNVNDKASLVKFSADLTACMNTLIGINYLHKMDNLDVLFKITKRLPNFWLSSWQTEVDNIIHHKREEVSVKHLADFVSLKTRQCTNFACDWSQSFKSIVAIHANVKRKQTSMATKVVTPPSIQQIKKCKLCEKLHFLNQCQQFRKMEFKERLEFVTNNRLCFSCLESGHFSSKCSRTSPCKKPDCTKRHTTLLHPPVEIQVAQKASSPPDQQNSDVKVSSGFIDATNTPPHKNLLPIVPVKVRVGDSRKCFVTHAFLDPGSTSSFASDSLIKRLNISATSKIEVTTVTINKVKETRFAKLIDHLEVSDLNESDFFKLQPLLSITSIPVSSRDVPKQADIQQFVEFSDLFIQDVDAGVELLIGNDNRHILQPLELINSDLGHYATRTVVGWVVNCPKHFDSTLGKTKCFFVKPEYQTGPLLCSLCADVESTMRGVSSVRSREQARFIDLVSTSIRHCEDTHYEIALPLRSREICLPSNRSQAEQRAHYLKRKLNKNPEFLTKYCQFMTTMLENGHAEKVPNTEKPEKGKVWYIPHHGVYHKDKPEKIRIVFDCSAKCITFPN